MKQLYFFGTLIFSMIFISCEGPKHFAVTVIDKQTKQPIDSVLVRVKVKRGMNENEAYNLQGYTDSEGKFTAEEMIGTGLSPIRFDFYMEYNKNGYADKTELNNTDGIIELERQQHH